MYILVDPSLLIFTIYLVWLIYAHEWLGWPKNDSIAYYMKYIYYTCVYCIHFTKVFSITWLHVQHVLHKMWTMYDNKWYGSVLLVEESLHCIPCGFFPPWNSSIHKWQLQLPVKRITISKVNLKFIQWWVKMYEIQSPTVKYKWWSQPVNMP